MEALLIAYYVDRWSCSTLVSKSLNCMFSTFVCYQQSPGTTFIVHLLYISLAIVFELGLRCRLSL